MCSPDHPWVAGRLAARKRLWRTWTTSASCSPPWRASRRRSLPPCRRLTTRASCLPPLSHPSACTPPRWSSSHTTGMLLRCVHCLSYNFPKPFIHSNSYQSRCQSEALGRNIKEKPRKDKEVEEMTLFWKWKSVDILDSAVVSPRPLVPRCLSYRAQRGEALSWHYG